MTSPECGRVERAPLFTGSAGGSSDTTPPPPEAGKPPKSGRDSTQRASDCGCARGLFPLPTANERRRCPRQRGHRRSLSVRRLCDRLNNGGVCRSISTDLAECFDPMKAPKRRHRPVMLRRRIKNVAGGASCGAPVVVLDPALARIPSAPARSYSCANLAQGVRFGSDQISRRKPWRAFTSC